MQYSLGKGQKLYGEQAEQATTKELRQLHNLDTFEPANADSLSDCERKNAFVSLMFLPENQDETINTRYVLMVGNKWNPPTKMMWLYLLPCWNLFSNFSC